MLIKQVSVTGTIVKFVVLDEEGNTVSYYGGFSRNIYYDTSSSEPFKIPDGITEIGDWFLSGCMELTKPPIIPETVTTIGREFLWGCRNLKKPPIIPDTVTTIGHDFLSYCTGLTRPPIIPSSVKKIENWFLSHCYSLTEPPILSLSVTSIGKGFLFGCDVKEPPIIPISVTKIGYHFLFECDGEFIDNYTIRNFKKWNIHTGQIVRPSPLYIKRKKQVRDAILSFVLDLPCHIIFDYILYPTALDKYSSNILRQELLNQIVDRKVTGVLLLAHP